MGHNSPVHAPSTITQTGEVFFFLILLGAKTIGNAINGGFRQLQLQGIYTICLDSFYFPQTISHQFLIADKLYSQITGNMSCLIQMAIAKIPYTSKHRTILIWSFVAALKCTCDLIFCQNMTTTQTTKLVLPFTGMYLWTFVFNYSIKIWKWYCCSDLLLENQFSKYITCIYVW